MYIMLTLPFQLKTNNENLIDSCMENLFCRTLIHSEVTGHFDQTNTNTICTNLGSRKTFPWKASGSQWTSWTLNPLYNN